MVLGMLFYTSCEQELGEDGVIHETFEVDDIASLSEKEEARVFDRLLNLTVQPKDWSYTIEDENSSVQFSKPANGDSFISARVGFPSRRKYRLNRVFWMRTLIFLHSTLPNHIKFKSIPKQCPSVRSRKSQFFRDARMPPTPEAVFRKKCKGTSAKTSGIPRKRKGRVFKGGSP